MGRRVRGEGCAIVFDLDGTLIDSAPDIRAIANALLAEEGAAPLQLDEVRSFIGNGAGVFVSRMMAARSLPDADHARLHRAFVSRYDSATGQTTLYPGAVAALDALRAAGCVLGICTNKPLAPARAVLAHFGLLDRFGTVIGGDSLPQHKPDPAPLRLAFRDLGQERQLYVGDSEVDHQTARAAQVPFALFTRGYRKSPVDTFTGATPFDDFDRLAGLALDLLAKAGHRPRAAAQ